MSQQSRDKFVLVRQGQDGNKSVAPISLTDSVSNLLELKTSNNSRAGRRSGMNNRSGISIPVPIDLCPVVRRSVYWRVATAISTSNPLTRGLIGLSLGAIGTSAASPGTVTSLLTSFKIRNVQLYLPGKTSGTQSEADLDWATGSAEQALTKDEHKVSTIPDGITVSGSAIYHPPKGAWSSMWQTTSENPTDPLIFLTAPVGTVLMINVDATLPGENASPYGYSLTSSSSTAGGFYFVDPSGSGKLNVVGAVTAF